METFNENRESDVEKALSTQHQLRIWDALLEVRIRMQKVLLESNKLPQTRALKQVADTPKAKELQLPSASSKAVKTVQQLLENLLQLQEGMIQANPETNGIINKKRKAEDDPEADQEDDEEITSSEDEEEAPPNKSLPQPNKGKRRRLEEFEKSIVNQFQKLIPYRNETIQKWNEKTQLSFGKFKGKNSSGPQIPTLKQISHILSDKERLVKRTQIKRTSYSVVGKIEEESLDNSAQDEEIFDDDDFYHQLLRELIDRKTSNINDPIQLGRHWLELQKLRNKLKRVVDTKASKGRRMRFDGHAKLVNFMAPQDNCAMSDSAVKELMNSLFGKLSS